MNGERPWEIERACQRLSLELSRHFDACDFDSAALLFTDDGEFVRPSTYPHHPVRGRKAIQELGATLPPGMRSASRHVCTNFIVDILAPDAAVCRSLFMRFGDNRPPEDRHAALPILEALRSIGEYEERMVRTSEGWRIQSRIGRFVLGSV